MNNKNNMFLQEAQSKKEVLQQALMALVIANLSVVYFFLSACVPGGGLSNVRVDKVNFNDPHEKFEVVGGTASERQPDARVFNVNYNTVWDATVLGVKRLKNAITYSNRSEGTINTDWMQHRAVLQSDWKDRFLIKVEKLESGKTMVSVTRELLVMKGRHALSGVDVWDNRVSDGQIELWLLTRIEDILIKKSNRNVTE